MPAGRVFVEDVKLALRAWRKDVRLPLLTTWLYLLTSLPELLSSRSLGLVTTIALVPVTLFWVGYVGTERLWYLRLWRGRQLTAGEIWGRSWVYFRRYLGLGLGVIVPLLPIYVVVIALTNQNSPIALVVSGLLTLVLDFFITFATPALAYTTQDPKEAVRINLDMIKTHRPHSFLYVLVPSLAVVLTYQITGRDLLQPVPYLALGVVTTLFNLLMKGATAAFYLRFNEVGEL